MAKAASRIEGASEIRPVRLGIAFSPSPANMQAAIRGATKCWGGMHFVFLDAENVERSLKIADALNVDAIWPLDKHQNSIALSREPGFFWRGFGKQGPFDIPTSSIPSSLVSPEWAINEGESGPFSLPVWEPDDPLASIFSAWFGEYDSSETLSTLFRNKASIARLAASEPIPSGVVNFHTPISTTALGVTYRGMDRRVGIMIIDPGDPSDLVTFWNLRASGARVFPWVDGESSRLMRSFESWMGRLAPSVPKWQSGDGSKGGYVFLSGRRKSLPRAFGRPCVHIASMLKGIIYTEGGREAMPCRHPSNEPFLRRLSLRMASSQSLCHLGHPLRMSKKEGLGS